MVATMAASGCSMIWSRDAPKHRLPRELPKCESSYALTSIDLGASLGAAANLAAMIVDGVYPTVPLVSSVVVAVLFATSGGIGASHVGDCRDAEAAFDRELADLDPGEIDGVRIDTAEQIQLMKAEIRALKQRAAELPADAGVPLDADGE